MMNVHRHRERYIREAIRRYHHVMIPMKEVEAEEEKHRKNSKANMFGVFVHTFIWRYIEFIVQMNYRNSNNNNNNKNKRIHTLKQM